MLPHPTRAFAPTARYLAFYPKEKGAPPGDFSGGWITTNIVVPFKGDPGTSGWLTGGFSPSSPYIVRS